MKIQTLILGLALSASAMADGISFNREGTAATLTGSLGSTSSEVLEYVGKAYDFGFKDAQGADFFTKVSPPRQGSHSSLTFKNPALTVSVDAAFAVVYKLDLKGKAGDIAVTSDRKSVTIKGESARMLMGALQTTVSINPRGPVGVGRVQTKSGKVVCTKVVAPRAVPTCTLSL